MTYWQEIVVVFFLSTFKYVLGGVPLALAFGFSFFKTVVITTSGGITGILFFMYLSQRILRKWKKNGKKTNDANKKIKITRTKRLIVRVKKKYGLPGIAVITPLILSIPLGCFVAVRYFKNVNKIRMYMFASVLLWSMILASWKLF